MCSDERIVYTAVDRNDKILDLEVTPWTKERDGRVYDIKMGFETTCNRASVDIVKLVSEDPWIFCIIDFKVAVGWDTIFSP
jgi:hypothetical protein